MLAPVPVIPGAILPDRFLDRVQHPVVAFITDSVRSGLEFHRVGGYDLSFEFFIRHHWKPARTRIIDKRIDVLATAIQAGMSVEDLERAIASLPEGARTVLILRDVYGYKYEEIATMQEVALGTVKAQIHRARRMMRERLDA